MLNTTGESLHAGFVIIYMYIPATYVYVTIQKNNSKCMDFTSYLILEHKLVAGENVGEIGVVTKTWNGTEQTILFHYFLVFFTMQPYYMYMYILP